MALREQGHGRSVIVRSEEVVNGVTRRFTVTQNGPYGLPEVRVEIQYEVCSHRLALFTLGI